MARSFHAPRVVPGTSAGHPHHSPMASPTAMAEGRDRSRSDGVSGIVQTGSGKPAAAGLRVDLFAWPNYDVLSRMAVGSSVKLLPVATTVTGPGGSFTLASAPTEFPSKYVDSDGRVNYSLLADTGDGTAGHSLSKVQITRPSTRGTSPAGIPEDPATNIIVLRPLAGTAPPTRHTNQGTSNGSPAENSRDAAMGAPSTLFCGLDFDGGSRTQEGVGRPRIQQEGLDHDVHLHRWRYFFAWCRLFNAA